MLKTETLTFKSSLPHEAAEGLVGGRIGGTAPAVRVESQTNANHAGRLIQELIEDADPSFYTHSILDTPEPDPRCIPPVDGVERINYQTPVDARGEVLQQWEMANAYMEDDAWLAQHIEPFLRPGRKIFVDHHTVGMEVGARLAAMMHGTPMGVPHQSWNMTMYIKAHSAVK